MNDAQLLIDKITDTFRKYEKGDDLVGIMDFMMLCIESAKLIDKQDKRINELEEIHYSVVRK